MENSDKKNEKKVVATAEELFDKKVEVSERLKKKKTSIRAGSKGVDHR